MEGGFYWFYLIPAGGCRLLFLLRVLYRFVRRQALAPPSVRPIAVARCSCIASRTAQFSPTQSSCVNRSLSLYDRFTDETKHHKSYL
jgi:hypothetical protein